MQEVAGKGLALVYEAADGDSRRALVDSLVDALSTGRRRAARTGAGGVDVHGTSHAGAALSEAGAAAYGDMCAVANDVGRPDLIYSFLSMASHHAAWTTRRRVACSSCRALCREERRGGCVAPGSLATSHVGARL